MKKVDFLFIYEVKARELENICLIRYELERRGYTVEFINTWYYLDKKVPKYEAKVVITFALYNDDTFNFVLNYVKKINKIVNMQWEQVGTVSDERSEKSRFLLKGIAKKGVHVCWGEKTKDRLINRCGIDKRNIMLVGHITLDFLRENMVKYYKTRIEIFNQYKIPLDKKVCLFISSFSYVNIPENILENAGDIGKDLHLFRKISVDSQREVLRWIELILQSNDDIIFIYRPHPAEANNNKINDLANKYNNFYVINDYSVKQWIIVCDIIYNWYSTSIAEIYVGGRVFNILRPVPIPEEMDLSICEGATFIDSYELFEKSLEDNTNSMPIDKEILLQYYLLDEEPTYMKICDNLVNIYYDDYYKIHNIDEIQNIPYINKLKMFLSRTFVNDIVNWLANNTKLQIPILERRRQKNYGYYLDYQKDLAERNYATKEEVDNIVCRIRSVLEDK